MIYIIQYFRTNEELKQNKLTIILLVFTYLLTYRYIPIIGYLLPGTVRPNFIFQVKLIIAPMLVIIRLLIVVRYQYVKR